MRGGFIVFVRGLGGYKGYTYAVEIAQREAAIKLVKRLHSYDPEAPAPLLAAPIPEQDVTELGLSIGEVIERN
jgi:hypothetical protein